MKSFPVLGEKNPTFVEAEKLDEEWALRIHGQTLDRLASRGGLSSKEIFLNLNRMNYIQIYSVTQNQADDAVKLIRLNQ